MTTIPPQGQPYGAVPGHGAPQVRPTQPPAPLAKAVTFMWAGAVFTVVGAAIGAFLMPGAAEQVMAGAGPEEARLMQGVVAGTSIMTVLMSLIIAGLWVWMAIMNKKGRSWARIVATVFGGLNLLMLLFSLLGAFTSPYVAWSLFSTLVQLVIVVGALVFLWNTQNNPYYDARSRA